MPKFKINKSIAISLIVAIAFFMEGLDTTAVNTAIPAMSATFNVNVIRLNLGITSYLIALAVFIPVSGWIADRFGTRNVFCGAVGLFTLASILCGLSQKLEYFVAFRILQGIGGALMAPVGRLAVLKASSKDQLITAMAYIAWPALLAPIVGPMIGGYFATYFTWHWIFFINVPIGIICIILAWHHIPGRQSANDVEKHFDLVGFLLSGFGFASFMVAIELLSNDKVPFYYFIILFIFSFSCITVNVLHSRRISNPLIQYRILKLPTFRIVISFGSLMRMLIGVSPYLVPLMFQTCFGFSPFKSGLLFMATMGGNLLMKPMAVWTIRHYKFKNVLVVNGFFIALFSLCTGILMRDTPIVLIIAVMFLAGMSRSLQFSAITTLAFADIPDANLTQSNTLFSTMQQMSQGVGIALGGVLLHFSNIINGSPASFEKHDFFLSFLFVSILTIIVSLGFLKLSPTAGNAVRMKKA